MLYAKSDTNESIKGHTQKLRDLAKQLRIDYGDQIKKIITIEEDLFWKLLDIAICFHDLGKAFVLFQAKMMYKLGLVDKMKVNGDFNNVRHNWISPSLIDVSSLNIRDRELILLVMQAIISHHSRKDQNNKQYLKESLDKILKEDLSSKIDLISEELCGDYKVKSNLNSAYIDLIINPITPDNKYYKEYVLIAGLLQRLDYSASAHELIEMDIDSSIGNHVIMKLRKLRDIQDFTYNNRDKNTILIAPAGAGKTEASLIWIWDSKGFITLPYRVSLNAIYDRIFQGYNYEALGLLHSASASYIDEKYELDGFDEYNKSRLLSQKLTLSTVDQLFKFPLMHTAYERELSTLSYSKVVIDELQAYDPDLAALIIKGIEMIHKMGGKFMIMTATMPQIYIDKLNELGVLDENLAYKDDFNYEVDRHMIKLSDDSIENNMNLILEQSLNNKVLIIANTVKCSIEIYKKIYDECHSKGIDVNLLHSRFIKKDRMSLESAIQEFSNSHKNGLWICTNLIEVSLDVDFNYLHTELSSLDSMIQRCGRCNRKGNDSILNENVYIYGNASGIGKVYDEDIYDKSYNLLKSYIGDDKIRVLDEVSKRNLVSDLYSYSNIKDTKYYERFKSTFTMLDTMTPYTLSSKKAQNIIRKISNITVIPISIYKQIENSLIKNLIILEDKLKEAKLNNKSEKVVTYKSEISMLSNEIEQYTVDIPTYYINKYRVFDIPVDSINTIKVIECEYDSKVGLILQ